MYLRVLSGSELYARFPEWESILAGSTPTPLSRCPRWLRVLASGLGHSPYAVEALSAGRPVGFLPLAHVQSFLFGRHLVSLPYLNYGGPVAASREIAQRLVLAAVELADRLQVRRLELRGEKAVEWAGLSPMNVQKAHLRLGLPATAEQLWKQIPSKVRNQVRKGQRGGFRVCWGGLEQLTAFYDVFTRNMRDLGTPAFGKGLFRAILKEFPDRAEVCVLRSGAKPVAAAILLHGDGTTEVPSASSLREYASSCANMLMYYLLLERAVQRGQQVFDFGRSTVNSPTYRFKTQWGAAAVPTTWQEYVRRGSSGTLRPENPRYRRWIELWKRLPLGVARMLGPRIVRGIP